MDIGKECHYSFDDLFRSSMGRNMSEEEKKKLYALPQETRNAWVRGFVSQSDGGFSCDESPRTGSDGQGYIAFWGNAINAAPYIEKGVPLQGGGDTHIHPFGNGEDAYVVTSAIPIDDHSVLKIHSNGEFKVVDK